MKNKTKRSLKEEILGEQAPVQYPQQISDFAPVIVKPVSLDQIVDRYIVRYERESIPLEGSPGEGGVGSTMYEDAGIKELVAFLLAEQAPPPPPPPAAPEEEEDEEAPAPEEDPGDLGIPGGEEPMDTSDAPPPPGEEMTPAVMNTPKINMNNFTRSVARLINNFNALLNPKSIILNRVSAYVASNYDERTAKLFDQVMKQNYGIRGTETETDSREEFPSPGIGQAGATGGSV